MKKTDAFESILVVDKFFVYFWLRWRLGIFKIKILIMWSNSAKLDNVTIQNGYTSGGAAGMYNNYASPEITNCTFSSNSASYGEFALVLVESRQNRIASWGIDQKKATTSVVAFRNKKRATRESNSQPSDP